MLLKIKESSQSSGETLHIKLWVEDELARYIISFWKSTWKIDRKKWKAGKIVHKSQIKIYKLFPKIIIRRIKNTIAHQLVHKIMGFEQITQS